MSALVDRLLIRWAKETAREGKEAKTGDNFTYRRYWFDDHMARVVQDGIDPLPWANAYTCPCCGYPMFEERGAYSVCSLCHWEDDGQDDPDADKVLGGPNQGYSLAQARENFKRYMIMYSPDKRDPRPEGPDSGVQQERKRLSMQLMNQMVGETDPAILRDLWQRAWDTQALIREVKRNQAQSKRKKA